MMKCCPLCGNIYIYIKLKNSIKNVLVQYFPLLETKSNVYGNMED